jgi:hypothetical protein
MFYCYCVIGSVLLTCMTNWKETDSGSGGQISWDWNSTFSGGWIFVHEVEIPNNDLISWSPLFSWDWN